MQYIFGVDIISAIQLILLTIFSVLSFGGYLLWLSDKKDFDSIIKKNGIVRESFVAPEYTFYEDLTNAKYSGVNDVSSDSNRKFSSPIGEARSYFVQVGLFRDRANADQVKAEITLLDVEQIMINDFSESENPLYRLTVGPFKSYSLAEDKSLFLRRNGYQSVIFKAR